MLTVDEILTPQVRDALKNPRKEAYFAKADRFAKDVLPQRLGAVEPAARMAFIKASYAQSAQRGFSKDADHLQYLMSAAYLGLYFETDPQFSGVLQNIGWFDGKTANLTDLAAEIDHFKTQTRSDLEDLARPATAFERHFIRNGDEENDSACWSLMKRAFPAHVGLLDTKTASAFIASVKLDAQTFDLAGADLVCHVAMALCFGHRFPQDPLYAWVQTAYSQETPQARRLQFGEGLKTYVERFTMDKNGQAPKERL